jgi:hypothetical protein
MFQICEQYPGPSIQYWTRSDEVESDHSTGIRVTEWLRIWRARFRPISIDIRSLAPSCICDRILIELFRTLSHPLNAHFSGWTILKIDEKNPSHIWHYIRSIAEKFWTNPVEILDTLTIHYAYVSGILKQSNKKPVHVDSILGLWMANPNEILKKSLTRWQYNVSMDGKS